MLCDWIISSLFKAFSRCSHFQHLGILKVTFFSLQGYLMTEMEGENLRMNLQGMHLQDMHLQS